MPISTPARLLASVASLALVSAAGLAQAQAQAVGTAAAVNPRSTSAGRLLELGSRIIHNERVSTSASGSVQVLFVDKTTLNIGPNSDVLIDKFVYDPASKKGSMAVSMTKGAVRFVGGNASHSEGATVKTPVATIGIRGGVAGITHRGGETRAVLQFGIMTVTSHAGETTVVRRPGFMVVVGPQGLAGPDRVSQGEIDQLIAETRSRSGQNGGRPEPTPDVTGLDKASAHPCSMPVQGQTLSQLAAASCSYVNRESQDAADDVAREASQQGQDSALIPLRFPEPEPQPYGYGAEPPPPPPPDPPPPTEPPPDPGPICPSGYCYN